ncbi:peptidylprolyl isomerase [Actinospica sp.]|uniref:peptidylprolyl isomerase n=1 Tax=Actinospica sp. TaxID=1872142 RepID=UPI002CBC73B3|nr:peptidylprolyl isomerase [Actinospica sp.]HWG23171.1 peptidylprolyl isomerase [Actinospica sp.]
MASTKDRQRALERARYERVQAKIQKKRRATQRRQRIAVVSSIAAIAVVAAVVAGVLATSSSPSTKTAASSTPSATASAASSANACTAAGSVAAETKGYHACGTAAKSGIGVPTYSAAAAKDYTVTLTTNHGDIVFTADGKNAPYTVESFVYLAEKGYYTNTKCHRLVWASGLFMLQCGDPTGSGGGTPGYAFQDENLASLGTGSSATYKAGTVAMANAGPGTNGSQFFLVGKDSTLAPSYTPWGTITKGLDILQTIGNAGAQAADSTGNTAPKDATTIEKVTVS